MKIFVQSNNLPEKILIDLINNQPVARWFEQCRKLQETHPIIGQLIFKDTANLATYPIGNESETYIKLLSTILKLETLLIEKQISNFIIPKLPSVFNRSQHWCNDIHNLFIDVSIWLEKTSNHYWQLTDSWDRKLFETAKELNILTHELEKWTYPTVNRQYVKQHSHKHLQTKFDLSYHGLGLWFELSEDEQEIYHSTYKNNTFYDVVFSNEILGKTYYKSFIDEETTDSPAISAIDKTWGNLDIKLDQQRELVFQSSKFQDWIDTVSENKLNAPLEFPVGSINSSSDIDYFVKRKVTEVTFHFVY